MFEHYTERARRAIFFARYEAAQAGSPVIDIEHLLLGVLRESKGLVSQMLRQRGVSLADLQRRLVEAPPDEPVTAAVDIPLSEAAKRALVYAHEESERAHSENLGVEHLLLGILRDKDSAAAAVLAGSGLTLEQARDDIAALAAARARPPADPSTAMEKLVRFLSRLEERGHRYQMSHPSGEVVRIEVTRGRELWEVDFRTSGQVEVRVFEEPPVVEGEEALERLFESES